MNKYEKFYSKKNVAYKYRPFDDCQFTLNLLEKGEVFFSSPAFFNDIFDTRLPVCSYDSRKVEIAANVIEDTRKNGLAVLCLSEVPDSIPMWTYYGGNNAGICIGFRLEKCDEKQNGLKLDDREVAFHPDFSTLPIPAYKVKYDPERQQYFDLDSTYNDNALAGLEFLFHKPKQLEHEKEIRVVVKKDMSIKEWPDNKFNGMTYHLGKGVIESIYLGPAFDYCKNLGVIKDLIKSPVTACSQARLYQIIPHRKYYQLEHKEIPFECLDEFYEYMVSNYKRVWGDDG